MARTVGIGIRSFEEVREQECFYIDKTVFVKEWWESKDKVTLITRPCRFGKTLNMSMLECFFSNKYAGRNDLFEGLAIWEEEKYRQIQGDYPVIYLSLAEVKKDNFESAADIIRMIIAETFGVYEDLLKENILTKAEHDFFVRVVSGQLSEAETTRSIHRLSQLLAKRYNKKVIILLDEYDTPLQEAWMHGYWDEMITFIRSFFNSTFKTNPHLDRAVMTGITRVSRESVFSDLNHWEVVTVTSEKYATSFGFTEDEVFAALEECGMGDKKEKVKRWYDGFVFGKQEDIYNPWSIINFLSKGNFEAHWANTSSNGLVGTLIKEGNAEIKEKFGKLLEGEILITPIDEQIVFNQLRGNEKAIWSLLVATGYLKVLKAEEYEDEDENLCIEPNYHLALTNREIVITFHNLVRAWFVETQGNYNGFVKALLKDDVKAMNRYMNRVTEDIFSYFDTGGKEPERFYHGFTLGLMVDLKKDYIITSNSESGFGRYDVMMEPRIPEERNGIILEFKIYDKEEEEGLQDTVAAALRQIDDMKYVAALIDRGIPEERIRSYGVAFRGREVLIGEG